MMKSWALKMVIGFVLRQLEKFSENIDWQKVEADLDARVRKLIPGTWFDDEAVRIAHAALTVIKTVLGQGDNIKRLLDLLTARKYDEAVKLLKEIILGYFSKPNKSFTVAELEVKDLVSEV